MKRSEDHLKFQNNCACDKDSPSEVALWISKREGVDLAVLKVAIGSGDIVGVGAEARDACSTRDSGAEAYVLTKALGIASSSGPAVIQDGIAKETDGDIEEVRSLI